MECDFRYWKLDSIDDDDGDEFFSVDSSVANLASMLDDDVGVDDDVASNVIFVDIVVWPPFDDDDDDADRLSADSCDAILLFRVLSKLSVYSSKTFLLELSKYCSVL